MTRARKVMSTFDKRITEKTSSSAIPNESISFEDKLKNNTIETSVNDDVGTSTVHDSVFPNITFHKRNVNFKKMGGRVFSQFKKWMSDEHERERLKYIELAKLKKRKWQLIKEKKRIEREKQSRAMENLNIQFPEKPRIITKHGRRYIEIVKEVKEMPNFPINIQTTEKIVTKKIIIKKKTPKATIATTTMITPEEMERRIDEEAKNLRMEDIADVVYKGNVELVETTTSSPVTKKKRRRDKEWLAQIRKNRQRVEKMFQDNFERQYSTLKKDSQKEGGGDAVPDYQKDYYTADNKKTETPQTEQSPYYEVNQYDQGQYAPNPHYYETLEYYHARPPYGSGYGGGYAPVNPTSGKTDAQAKPPESNYDRNVGRSNYDDYQPRQRSYSYAYQHNYHGLNRPYTDPGQVESGPNIKNEADFKNENHAENKYSHETGGGNTRGSDGNIRGSGGNGEGSSDGNTSGTESNSELGDDDESGESEKTSNSTYNPFTHYPGSKVGVYRAQSVTEGTYMYNKRQTPPPYLTFYQRQYAIYNQTAQYDNYRPYTPRRNPYLSPYMNRYNATYNQTSQYRYRRPFQPRSTYERRPYHSVSPFINATSRYVGRNWSTPQYHDGYRGPYVPFFSRGNPYYFNSTQEGRFRYRPYRRSNPENRPMPAYTAPNREEQEYRSPYSDNNERLRQEFSQTDISDFRSDDSRRKEDSDDSHTKEDSFEGGDNDRSEDKKHGESEENGDSSERRKETKSRRKRSYDEKKLKRQKEKCKEPSQNPDIIQIEDEDMTKYMKEKPNVKPFVTHGPVSTTVKVKNEEQTTMKNEEQTTEKKEYVLKREGEHLMKEGNGDNGDEYDETKDVKTRILNATELESFEVYDDVSHEHFWTRLINVIRGKERKKIPLVSPHHDIEEVTWPNGTITYRTVEKKDHKEKREKEEREVTTEKITEQFLEANRTGKIVRRILTSEELGNSEEVEKITTTTERPSLWKRFTSLFSRKKKYDLYGPEEEEKPVKINRVEEATCPNGTVIYSGIPINATEAPKTSKKT